MLNTPFTQWPMFTQEEADAVQRVLLSNRVNYWTGMQGQEFEREFAAWAQTAHAIALANGTVALEAALKGLGIGPGDEVVVTPRSFLASTSCVVNVGALPVFADVDREWRKHHGRQPSSAVLTPRTRSIVCVHLAGMAVRHGSDHGARRAARLESDRGLRAGARRSATGAAASAASATSAPGLSARTRS